MAKQNQPSSGGGGSAPETSLFYEFETENLTGEVGGPSDKRPWPDKVSDVSTKTVFKTSDVFNPEAPDSPTQRILAPIFKMYLDSVNISRLEDSYANNFIINLHNYNYPMPIPLQLFASSIELFNSKDAPYQSCNMTLALPVQIAMDLLSGPDSHPEPGQWIVIRQRPNDPNNSAFEKVLGKRSGSSLDNLQFIGTISNIEWDIATDAAGNVIANVSILASSFIHNLVYAEYKIKPSMMKDQEFSEIPGDEDLLVSDDSHSSSYMISWTDWYSLIQREALAASGKVSLRKSLSTMINALGYPLLPVSMRMEPMDLASFLNAIAGGGLDIQELVGRLALHYDEATLKALLSGVLSVYEIIAIDSPIINYDAVRTNIAQIYAKYTADSGVNGMFENASDTTEEIIDVKDLLKHDLEAFNQPIRISSIIHVATTRDDLPPSHPMWACMPHDDLPFVDINRIKNVNMETTTVWDLLQGTFQPDDNIIEFYPTIINISERDVEYFKEQSIDIKPIHRLLGGMPTLILRMKPMHPLLGRDGISKQSIDKQKLKAAALLKGDTSAVNKLHYKTASEMMSDVLNGRKLSEYRDSSLGQQLPYYVKPTVPSSHPDYIRAIALPPQIYGDEIIRLRFNQSDRARVNSTKVINPQTKNMSGKLRYAIDGDAVQNVYSAVRHGLRSYDPVWPYNEFRSTPTSKPNGDEAPNYALLNTHLSERCYMIMGDDQKYFEGTLQCGNLIDKGIVPGVWVEVIMKKGVYAKNVKPNDILLIYITSISYDYNINQDTGNVECTSNINFRRGSYGGLIPNFPFFRGPHIAKLKPNNVDDYTFTEADLAEDDYVFDTPIDTNDVALPEIEPIVKQTSITERMLRQFVIGKIQNGDMTPSEGKVILALPTDLGIASLPKDDMTKFNAILNRFGILNATVDGLVDSDGTPE